MELAPDHLHTGARRWDALAADLDGAAARLRWAPVGGLGGAAGEAALLLDVAETTVSRLAADTDGVVDGLLVSVRAVVDADEAVAASLSMRAGEGA